MHEPRVVNIVRQSRPLQRVGGEEDVLIPCGLKGSVVVSASRARDGPPRSQNCSPSALQPSLHPSQESPRTTWMIRTHLLGVMVKRQHTPEELANGNPETIEVQPDPCHKVINEDRVHGGLGKFMARMAQAQLWCSNSKLQNVPSRCCRC